ncbi:hypothetical protein Cni_G18614 [Canna indica]|uniref:Uncharacterized protein n=1 Tax=Canna indica TaxID=4628 RepID=A0AAQ3QEI2_9LILI|nr:hypothetical protein Cni_G18614 [Canna indica]
MASTTRPRSPPPSPPHRNRCSRPSIPTQPAIGRGARRSGREPQGGHRQRCSPLTTPTSAPCLFRSTAVFGSSYSSSLPLSPLLLRPFSLKTSSAIAASPNMYSSSTTTTTSIASRDRLKQRRVTSARAHGRAVQLGEWVIVFRGGRLAARSGQLQDELLGSRFIGVQCQEGASGGGIKG